MTEFWEGLGRTARAGLVAGLAAIVLGTAALAWWLLRADYQVLFSDLKPQDAAAMSAELDKLKIPYQFDEGQGALLVDKAQVLATRLKLMGQDMPLQGAVGFELFNNTDFGMTEFAQKINYQRALQGELTRTIQSLSEIRDVRVHLALPEQGLFKQAQSRPKAAITITLRDGQRLRAEQVSGIQRLVAAATPGMAAQDVTVVDRQGVAMSRTGDGADAGPDAAGTGAGSGRLELKAETEAQLARKAAAVLDSALGAGQALASVDVMLNMDHVRITTEDVIPAASRTADSRGVIVKERESVRDGGQPPLDAARAASAGGASTQREVDYQVGRRVEQVVSQAGSVRRIQVVAVVRQTLDGAQEDKLRRLLAAAVGAIPERGDTIVVQSMQALLPAGGSGSVQEGMTPSDSPASADAQAGAPGPTVATGRPQSAPSGRGLDMDLPLPWQAAAAVILCLAVVLFALRAASAGRHGHGRASGARALSDADREAALRKLRQWMQPDSGQAAHSTQGPAA